MCTTLFQRWSRGKRNASCFINLFHVKNQLHFSKRIVSQIPYLYSRVSLISTSKYPILHTNPHKIINTMAPESDHNWCKTTPIQSITTSHLPQHPFRAITFIIIHFGSTQESSYPSPMHRQQSFTIFGFSTSPHHWVFRLFRATLHALISFPKVHIYPKQLLPIGYVVDDPLSKILWLPTFGTLNDT